MASRANSKLHEIALSSGWGSLEFVLGDDDVVRLLRVAIEREGGQVAFAKRQGVNRTYLNMVLHKKERWATLLQTLLGYTKCIRSNKSGTSAIAPAASPHWPQSARPHRGSQLAFAGGLPLFKRAGRQAVGFSMTRTLTGGQRQSCQS